MDDHSGWEFNCSHGASTSSIPSEASRGIHVEICGLDDVFPPNDIGSGLYTQFIIVCIPCIKAVIIVIELSAVLVSVVYFNCIPQDSLYYDMDIGNT